MSSASTSVGPRIGVWGTFDLPDYGALGYARIVERELRRRLPHAQVTAYSPLGHEHPIPLDGGRPAVPLGAWSEFRARELAYQLDLVTVGGGELIHTRDDLHADAYGLSNEEAKRLAPSRFFIEGLGAELERRCPAVWHAVGVPFDLEGDAATRVKAALETKRSITVRDRVSHERLVATGTEREVAIVPDPLILIDRVFDREVLRKRLEYLRAMGWYPPDEAPLVVQGDRSLAARAAEVRTAATHALQGAPLVVLRDEREPGNDDFARAFASAGAPVYQLPEALTLEDAVTAIAHARAFCGNSVAGQLTALAFARASLPLNSSRMTTSEDFAGLLRASPSAASAPREEVLRRADAQFDELAELAERSWAERVSRDGDATPALARMLAEADGRYTALARAYDERGEELLIERLRAAELTGALAAAPGGQAGGEALARVAELQNKLELLDAERAAASSERDSLRCALDRVRTERDELRAQLQRSAFATRT